MLSARTTRKQPETATSFDSDRLQKMKPENRSPLSRQPPDERLPDGKLDLMVLSMVPVFPPSLIDKSDSEEHHGVLLRVDRDVGGA
jgi:hypothetical protein